MNDSHLELTPFVMTRTQHERPRWADAPNYTRKKRYNVRARSMWVKMGVCLALLAAVILCEVLLVKRGESVMEVSASEDSAGIENEDTLGRLRFVEAGGVRSVFKVSQRWDAPVAAQKMEKLEDDTLLKLLTEPGTAVSACAAGEVAAIGRDDSYGAYVRIRHGGELESIYYNLTEIRVEEGQPLSALDTLGRVDAEGCVYVRVRRAGAPLDPTEFIEAGGQD